MNSRWLSAFLALLCAYPACKKEDPPASYPQTAAAPAPAVYPAPVTPAPAPGPAPAPVAGAAAVGLPCASEQDLQCAFSHCIGSRCGGCQSGAECKPGAQCLPTWLGYACFPGAAATPPVTQGPAPVALPSPAVSTAAPLDALRARCVQRTNEFRARVSLAGLGRRQDREACIDGEAQSDAQSGRAHGAFGQCQEGGQNECPGWPGPLEQVVDNCLSQMFAEGPGPFAQHGHYLNMTDPKFSSVACGFATAANGQIWLVQDFYR